MLTKVAGVAGSSVIAAAQLLSSVALIVVTWRYVDLTRQLASSQEAAVEHARNSADREALARVLDHVRSGFYACRSVGDCFLMVDPSTFEGVGRAAFDPYLQKAASDIEDHAKRAHEALDRVRPEFRGATLSAVEACLVLNARVWAFGRLMTKEMESAKRDSREPVLDSVKRDWIDERNGSSDSEASWDALVSGKAIESPRSACAKAGKQIEDQMAGLFT